MVYDTQITNYSIPGVNLNQDSHHGGGPHCTSTMDPTLW